ncbi:lipopolysaccharide biosynthesis protein [Sphingobacterium corticibacter]|uniref:Flippase n=1 Tax=Sphingobacterium corticibacter TaxID=2171749 RepID=A0A2T8HJX7_9SPHI|nr:lipopolysaccharide biosynthesis protein [Sphingobacterium corticibacter]PVH25680.1 flippase [Sphingobacterium corticibacter]
MDPVNPAPEESLKKKAAKGFLWGGLSNGVQQVIGLVFGLVLLRVLDPKDYGLVGILTIFSAIASALTESGFVSAISIKKDVSKADYNAVFWFCVLLGAGIYLVLYSVSPFIADFYELAQLEPLSKISFLNFLISSFGVAHSAYLTRNLMVKERSTALLFAVLISNVIGVIAALQGLKYWSLVIQNLTYCVISASLFWYYSHFRPLWRINLRPVKPLLSYSSKLIITNVFFHVNNNFLTAILGKYVPVAQVGQYTSGNKWNLMGQNLILSISNTIIQPLMTEVSHSEEERKIRVFRKLLSFISFITFPLMFGLALIAPDFLLLAGGAKWLESADYLRVLAFGGAFAVVSNAFSNYTLSKGRSTTYMWNMIVFGILQVGLFFALKHLGVLYIVLGYATMNLLWLNTWFFITRKSLQYSYRFMWRDVYAYALSAVVGFLATYFWIDILPHAALRLAVSVLSMGAVYLGICYLFSRETFQEIQNFFRNKL